MVKIKLNVEAVKRCAKEGCRKPGPYHRHHIRHKKYWINRFEEGPRSKVILVDERWPYFVRRLKERYHRWLPRDLVLLCNYHHAEIHKIYEQIIYQQLYESRGNVSVRDAVRCMVLCKQALREWLKKPSKGVSPTRAGWSKRRT